MARIAGVSKRGDTWSFRIDVGVQPDGKRKQLRRGGFRTQKLAADARNEVRDQLHRGDYVEPSKRTVGSFLVDEWLPAIEPDVRRSTWTSYRNNVDMYIVPLLGTVVLQQLTSAKVKTFLADLQKTGGKAGRPVSPRTAQYAGAVLRKALNDAVAWNFVNRNPVINAKLPKLERKRMTTWSPEQVRAFLDAVTGDRLAAAWSFLALTGCRRSELLALKWADVDLDAAKVEIQEARVLVGREVQTGPPKSGAGRPLDLPAQLVTVLRAHRKAQAAERLAWGPAYRDGGYVFAKEDGSPLHPEWLSKRFHAIVRAAGLPRIRLHDLRHTVATIHLQAGTHFKTVAEQLGHSNPTVTMVTYSHVSPTTHREATERLAALVFGDDAQASGS